MQVQFVPVVREDVCWEVVALVADEVAAAACAVVEASTVVATAAKE